MNQTCKVCGEPAAGFHFGAFTCEGCKSFFGRSYNNLSSISECKNNGECIINKKNRTACKACRLRKCLMVGMSKSGSRYGRRSNWFKIHCLLQQQQQDAAAAAAGGNNNPKNQSQAALSMLSHQHGAYPHHGMYSRPGCTKEEMMLMGMDDYKHPTIASPAVSSPDSHNSDSSIEVGDRRGSLIRKHHDNGPTPNVNKDLYIPLPFTGLSSLPLMPPPGFPPPHLLFPGYHQALFSHHQNLNFKASADAAMASAYPNHFIPNNNNNHHHDEELTKRFYLEAVLKSQRSPSAGTTKSEEDDIEPDDVASMTPPRSPCHTEDNPIDLSMKTGNSLPDADSRPQSIDVDVSVDDGEMMKRKRSVSDTDDCDNDIDVEHDIKRTKMLDTIPLDLTAKV